jgi:hypothetical protein
LVAVGQTMIGRDVGSIAAFRALVYQPRRWQAGHSVALFAAPATPGIEASDDVETSPTPTDAYCKFQVLGTGDPNDIRADLNATLTHAFAAQIGLSIVWAE